MTPERWLTLLAIAVSMLGVCVPVLVTVMLRKGDQHRAEKLRLETVIAKQDEVIERQRDAIVDYKIAQRDLNGPVLESVKRILASLPVSPREGGGE